MVSWHRTALTERNAVQTAGRVGLGASSAPIRSVNAATLDEARRLVLSLRASSSAVTQTPSAQRPRSTP